MKIFTVYSKKPSNPIHDMVFIVEGFCLKAFIFNLFWALYNKIWWLSSLILIINSLLYFVQTKHLINDYYVYIINMFINFSLGLFGYDFYRNKLIHDGYKLIDIVASENLDKAKFRFLEKFASN